MEDEEVTLAFSNPRMCSNAARFPAVDSEAKQSAAAMIL